MKWDGVRCIARVADGRVTLTSRNDLDLTPTYPELQELAEHVHADGAVLDGEIVALDAHGRPSFSRLQQRMGLTRKQDVEPAMRRQAVRLLLFDVLEVDGTATTRAPYRDRRDLLERLVEGGGPIDVPPVVATATGDDLRGRSTTRWRRASGSGSRASWSSAPTATYRPGARSKDWVKRKHERQQEVVVGGWRPGNGRRRGRRRQPAGRRSTRTAGCGTSAGSARASATPTSTRSAHGSPRTTGRTSPFDDVPRADASDAHWVTPSLVGEVRFAEWTDDGRLRQASWRGLAARQATGGGRPGVLSGPRRRRPRRATVEA